MNLDNYFSTLLFLSTSAIQYSATLSVLGAPNPIPVPIHLPKYLKTPSAAI